MLAKTVEKGGPEWDEKLPYVLFAYRASQQASTGESPFYLVYGRDPRLPTPAVMTPKKTRATADLKEYGLALHQKMAEAWELARRSIGRAQKRQKSVYVWKVRMPSFEEGERVFLYRPAEKTGAARKFARAFHGPYRMVELGSNTVKIRRVDCPEEEPILVADFADVRKNSVMNSGLQDELSESQTASTTPITRRNIVVPSVQIPGDDTRLVNQQMSVGGAEAGMEPTTPGDHSSRYAEEAGVSPKITTARDPKKLLPGGDGLEFSMVGDGRGGNRVGATDASTQDRETDRDGAMPPVLPVIVSVAGTEQHYERRTVHILPTELTKSQRP